MRRTLTWQLTARHLVILGLLLLGSAAFQYVALHHVLLTAAGQRLASVVRQPLAHYDAEVAAGTPPQAAAAELVAAVTDPRTAAQVVGADGTVLAAAPAGSVPPQPPARAGRAPAPPRPGQPGRPVQPHRIGDQLAMAVPLPPGGPGPVLVVSTPATDVLGVLGSELRLLLFGGIGALLLGGASGALAVRQALVPLRDITAVAGRIAFGDLGLRAGRTAAPEEVAALAAAFDRMVDRLTEAIAEERATARQMRQFLDDASHELRTPLTALSGTLEVLQGQAGRDPEVVRDGLRAAYRQARRMAQLVSGLLGLARAERPDGPALAPTDLAGVLAAIRPEAERLAADHALDWRPPHGPLPVLASADALGGAVLNVVDNAARYSPPGAAIRVEAHGEDGRVVITVRDDGPGIAPEHLPHVFERFYRCPPAAGTAPPGTGLGLAIVRSVLERHGGTATVESQWGQGTVVRLALPRHEGA